MTEKHTPGPWITGFGLTRELGGEVYGVGVDTSPDWTPICIISEDGKVTESDNANARLIAAAPELLEALSEYLAAMDSATFHFDKPGAFKAVAATEKARKAIAKATGGAP